MDIALYFSGFAQAADPIEVMDCVPIVQLQVTRSGTEMYMRVIWSAVAKEFWEGSFLIQSK